MKNILLVACFAVSFAGLAMPKPTEIEKAQPLVVELMAEDVAAFRKGKKTASDVGESALAYAKKADSEASKYVLYEGAMQFFVRGKEYDRAADAIEALRGAVKDIPYETIVNLIRATAKGVRGKDAPRLLAIMKEAQLHVDVRKHVAEAGRSLLRKPADLAARRSLAEWLAVGGEWDKALEAFAVCGKTEKKIAECESGETNLVVVADFWWTYSPVSVPSDDAFKKHAIDIYKSCIDDGTLTGLKKTVVEKRINQESSYTVIDTPTSQMPRQAKKCAIVMRDCGGYALSETPVTREQWVQVMGGDKPSEDMAKWPMTNITWDEATNFCARLTAAKQASKPYRLPTAEEWRGAFRRGKTETWNSVEGNMSGSWRERYCKVGWFGQNETGQRAKSNVAEWYRKNGKKYLYLNCIDATFPSRVVNANKDNWLRWSSHVPMPVALKPANELGLYDMAGNVFEMVYDRTTANAPRSWYDTEYGFLYKGTPPGTDAPVLLGQPFTPAWSAEQAWGMHFPKMPHVGFRVAQ